MKRKEGALTEGRASVEAATNGAAARSVPALSVVIETVNTEPGRYDPLDALFRALAAQTLRPEEMEFIVVIDPDRHPDLSKYVAATQPQARIVTARGQHYYAQKNLGARHARGPLVGFIDSDCLPAATWAASIVDAFARHDDRLGAVQGTIWSDQKSTLANAFLVSVFGHLQARRERRTPSLAANNCGFRRADLVADPFEEAPVFHGPDVRMVARLAEQGRYVLLVPGAADRHRFLPGWRGFWQRGLYWGYCFLDLRRKARSSVPYARLFQRLGPLAPLALVPAKAAIDLKRLFDRRDDLELSAGQMLRCAVALAFNSLAAGYGAALALLRQPPPPSPY